MNNSDFIDIHDFDRQLERAMNLLNNSKSISDNNKDTIKKFLNKCSSDGISQSRRKKYVYSLMQMCEWIKKKDILTTTTSDCDKVFSDLESGKIRKKDGGRYMEETISDYKKVMKKFFKCYGKVDIASNIKLKRIKNKISPDVIWTDKERRSFIEHGRNSKEKAFLSMLSETGCRIGEIGSLQIKNVVPLDGGEYQIFIQRSKTEQRTIICIWSAPYISEWLSEHPDKSNPNAPLWTKTKYPYSALCYASLKKYVKIASYKAGIMKPCNPHILRHTDTTIKLRSGYNPYLLAKQKGISLKRIEQTYEHLKPEDIFNEERRYNGRTVNNGRERGLTMTCKKCGSPMSDGMECVACKRITQEMLLQKERIEQQRAMIQQEFGSMLSKFFMQIKDLPNETASELITSAERQDSKIFLKLLKS